jgi:lysophospholipase L1-like esterase
VRLQSLCAILSLYISLTVLSGSSTRALAANAQHWIATWTTEPVNGTANTATFENQTFRNVVRISVGGDTIRVRLSNYYGSKPLRVGTAHVAIRAEGSSTAPGSDRALTFAGKPGILIPGGGLVISDPVQLRVKDLEQLVVSIYFPGAAGGAEATVMDTARQTNYLSGPGDQTAAPDWKDAKAINQWFYLGGIEVQAPENVGVIAVMGDSITNCSQCPIDANVRWPDFLAERFVHEAKRKMAVVNPSHAGNRIIYDGNGDNAFRRFDRDVLDVPGITHLIIYLGINDIGRPDIQAPPPQGYPGTSVTADEMIAALQQLALLAHEHGIKIFASTITPFENTTFFQACCYYNPEGEAKRQTVNQWIRTNKELDGVIDLEKAVRDPNHPTQWLPVYDRGDHLHSGPAGNKHMAESVDLKLFQ